MSGASDAVKKVNATVNPVQRLGLGETGVGRVLGGDFLFGGDREPELPKKPELTSDEAAEEQAREAARVKRLRSQAGFSGTDAILTKPKVGGTGGSVGGY